MNENINEEWSYLDELDSLTEGNTPGPVQKKATFQAEKLEDRVLFSATWVDTETGDDAPEATDSSSESESPTNENQEDDLFDGFEDNDPGINIEAAEIEAVAEPTSIWAFQSPTISMLKIRH